MFWIYSIPSSLLALLCVTVASLLGIVGLFLARPVISRVLNHGAAPDPERIEAHNGAVNTYLSVIGLFYGLTLGLISVSVWQAYSDVESRATAEAAKSASLGRAFGAYPGAYGRDLKRTLTEYTYYTIFIAWPSFQKGKVPTQGPKQVNRMARKLYAFNPVTESEKALHAETLSQFDEMSEMVRMRSLSVTNGLPGALWLVVLGGGALTVATTYLFVLPSLRLHLLLTGLASAMIGLMLFLMAAMDYPFRGDFAVSPSAFKVTYNQLIRSTRESPST